MFAKLFNTKAGQILVKKDSEEDGPEIRIYFEPNGLGICSISFNWSKDDEMTAWDKVDRTFEMLDEAKCVALVNKTINEMAEAGLTDAIIE